MVKMLNMLSAGASDKTASHTTPHMRWEQTLIWLPLLCLLGIDSMTWSTQAQWLTNLRQVWICHVREKMQGGGGGSRAPNTCSSRTWSRGMSWKAYRKEGRAGQGRMLMLMLTWCVPRRVQKQRILLERSSEAKDIVTEEFWSKGYC